MTRTRASAKAAGSRFERLIADYLAQHVDERIDRRVKAGSKDRGDVAGLRSAHGHRIVVEAKNCTRLDLAGWAREAALEAANDEALLGVIIHKRHGNAAAGEQWVTCTLADLVALITGQRP